MISIKELNKAEVLAALYNNSRVQGLGYLQAEAGDMRVDQAEQILTEQTNFDYLKGRIMKVNLVGDEFEEWLYDRDNGEGAAKRAIDRLR